MAAHSATPMLAVVVLLLILIRPIIRQYELVVLADDGPICPSTGEYICSPEGNFGDTTTQLLVLNDQFLKGPWCSGAYYDAELYVYRYSACSSDGFPDPYCNECFKAAAEVIKQQCPNKVGAQYGTKDCCMRYETYAFC